MLVTIISKLYFLILIIVLYICYIYFAIALFKHLRKYNLRTPNKYLAFSICLFDWTKLTVIQMHVLQWSHNHRGK